MRSRAAVERRLTPAAPADPSWGEGENPGGVGGGVAAAVVAVTATVVPASSAPVAASTFAAPASLASAAGASTVVAVGPLVLALPSSKVRLRVWGSGYNSGFRV
jgi:hypothetical protein